MVPDLKRGQAMHSARHMVADELKDQCVFIEFRNDFLGHKGKGEGEKSLPFGGLPVAAQRSGRKDTGSDGSFARSM